MKVFTVSGKDSFAGTEVTKLSNYSQEIQAIVIGSNNNGCRLSYLTLVEPVNSQFIYHAEIYGRSIYGSVKNGRKYEIKALNSSKDNSKALLVLKTPVFSGGKNFHSGDRKNCICYRCEIEYDITQDICNQCNRKLKVHFLEFPGAILAHGTIRDSKKPVFGDQYICIVKKNQVFRTAYDGYVFGNESCLYHWFDGYKVVSISWEERNKKLLY
jgi:hypothetical protein